MTPKEKAKELLEKMNVAYRPKGNGLPVDMHKSQVKRCAFLAVVEIQKLPNIGCNHSQDESQYDYWQEVKEEINNL